MNHPKLQRLVLVLAVVTLFFLSACSGAGKGPSKKDKEEIAAFTADFFKKVQVVLDPMMKDAAMKEDTEPEKAKEYFDAHEKLRNMMSDPERKSVILAAMLQKEPTALRPVSYEAQGEAMKVVVALGPTDAKTGVLAIRRSKGAWVIEDFDGVFEKRTAMQNDLEKARAVSEKAGERNLAEKKGLDEINGLAEKKDSAGEKDKTGLTPNPAGH